MTTGFDLHPRRVVRLPNGQQRLVLIRRNVSAKFNIWNSWDLRWEAQHLLRWLRRDRSWRVEMYIGVDSDPGGVPRTEANHYWTAPNRNGAETLAERVSALLAAQGGIPDASQP